MYVMGMYQRLTLNYKYYGYIYEMTQDYKKYSKTDI
jgi:hypothetical protein